MLNAFHCNLVNSLLAPKFSRQDKIVLTVILAHSKRRPHKQTPQAPMANKSQKRSPKNSKPKNKTPYSVSSMPMPQLVLQDTIQAKRISDQTMDYSSFTKLIDMNYVGNPTTFRVQIIGPNAERMAQNTVFLNSFKVGVAKQDQSAVTVISRKHAIECQSVSKCDQGIELVMVVCIQYAIFLTMD